MGKRRPPRIAIVDRAGLTELLTAAAHAEGALAALAENQRLCANNFTIRDALIEVQERLERARRRTRASFNTFQAPPEGEQYPTSFFASLSPERRKRVLAYRGDENHGDPAFLRRRTPSPPQGRDE